ncbi:DUF4811 domain-containing protein [Pediococcus damnosus]|uniref:DUF4811 domain-containing protein n=1 Tax=Pediococcus damnosus TaxID=51663 RepID=UPI000C1CAF8D|nr:DUF4811 domain-containing protein [Pediococcus damnosus]PIO84916.1 hypothetical protein BSQ37_02780 [Pediococcus damnosus]
MILVSLFVGVICFIIGLLLLKATWQQLLVGGIGFVLLVGSAALMIGNDTNHWGMHKVTYEKKENISSLVTDKRMPLLVYEPIRKSDSEKVYIYRHLNSTKDMHTQASLKTKNRVEQRGTKATLKTTTTYWKMNAGFWKFWFARVTSQRRFSSRENKFTISNNWHILSRNQAEWLSKTATAKEKAGRSEIKTVITQNVEKAVRADPTMSKKDQQVLEQRVKSQVEAQAKQKATAELQQLVTEAKQQSVH